jgi:hypothetical protein
MNVMCEFQLIHEEEKETNDRQKEEYSLKFVDVSPQKLDKLFSGLNIVLKLVPRHE